MFIIIHFNIAIDSLELYQSSNKTSFFLFMSFQRHNKYVKYPLLLGNYLLLFYTSRKIGTRSDLQEYNYLSNSLI